MFKLDNNFLHSLGLGSLPVEEKNKLLQAIYERLEMNVGMRLAEGMSEAQMGEFEGFIDRKDEAGALGWLESNFPNYKQVVADELNKLKDEISQAAPHILAAAQQQMVPQTPVSVDPNVPVAPLVQNQMSQPSTPQPPQRSHQNQVAGQQPMDNSGISRPLSSPPQSDSHQSTPSPSPQIPSWPSQQPPPGPGV